MTNSNASRFEKANVSLPSNLGVEGYRSSDGEFRVSMSSVSIALGFSSDWLVQATTENGETFKSLQRLGYRDEPTEKLLYADTGKLLTYTISLHDFTVLIMWASLRGNQAAIDLQAKLVDHSMSGFIRDSLAE
jgi:hypothetical protein